MTPKQQAVRLFDEIDEIVEYLLPKSTVKKLAIHEVNAILSNKLFWEKSNFWQEVQKEIEEM